MAAIFISHRSSDNADAFQLKRWLEDQGHKGIFLDFDPADGIPVGADWEQTIRHHLRQCQALLIILTPDWLTSNWCFAELALARDRDKAVFVVRTKPVQSGPVIPALQEVDLTKDRDAALAKLAFGLKERGLDPRDAFAWHPGRPIYPGLSAFEEEDAAIFFGRSKENGRAVESLDRLRRQGCNEPRLVLITGASGSGKSSLMRAGIIPRLKKCPGQWLPIRPFRRGADAITEFGDALAWAFTRYQSTAAPGITTELRAAVVQSNGEWLRACARELRRAAGFPEATVLIAIDQAEELLAPKVEESAQPGELLAAKVEESANQLLYLLGDALSQADRELMAIATIRSDTLGLWQQHPAVRGMGGRPELTFETFPLGPMPLDRVPEIIRGPARYTRLQIDDELVDAVRADVKTPDALPLLAYTLQQLHAGSGNNGRLTLDAYKDMLGEDMLGGLEGSIRKIADESIDLQKLSKEDKDALRITFIPTLVRATEAGGFARERALRERLPRRAGPLIQKLVDAHLLVTDQDSQGRETVEIAHEALLRRWPTLTGWLDEDRDKLRQRNAIRRAAQEWDENHRSADHLAHREGRLEDARELVSERRFAFLPGSVEQQYLEACQANQRAREAGLRRLAVVLAVVAVTAIGAAIFGFLQKGEAERAATLARKQAELARKADREKSEVASQAHVSLARVANEAGKYAEALAHLAQAIRLNQENGLAIALTGAILTQKSFVLPIAGTMRCDKRILSVRFSPDGQRVVTASGNNAQLWAAATGEPIGEPMRHEGPVTSAQFSPDGQWVAIAFDYWLRDAATGKPIGEPVHYGKVQLWEVTTGKPIGEPLRHAGPVYSVEFSPDSKRVATACDDHSVRLWDAATGKPVGEPLRHEGPVDSAEFSPRRPAGGHRFRK